MRYTMFLSIRVWTVNISHQVLFVCFPQVVSCSCLVLSEPKFNKFGSLSTLFIYYVFNLLSCVLFSGLEYTEGVLDLLLVTETNTVWCTV